MGQQNEKVARLIRGQSLQSFGDAKTYCNAKRLERVADFLRCGLVDAAMHKQMYGRSRKFKFDS